MKSQQMVLNQPTMWKKTNSLAKNFKPTLIPKQKKLSNLEVKILEDNSVELLLRIHPLHGEKEKD